MRRVKKLGRFLRILALFLISSAPIFAQTSLPHNSNPISWMHSLPTGETPGWTQPYWTELELSYANIWNKTTTWKHRITGDLLTYGADFEQTNYIVEAGAEITKTTAFAIELPYANRDGGFADPFIEKFHETFNLSRFERSTVPQNQNSFVVKTNGASELSEHPLNGSFSNLKLKFKFWPLQWKGEQESSGKHCACGFALSAHLTIPVSNSRDGFASGSLGSSYLAHFGVPLGAEGGIWISSGVTLLGKNEVFEKWPRNNSVWMYEATVDLPVATSWGLILQVRTESPLMNEGDLLSTDSNPHSTSSLIDRQASGWNGLVYWRTYSTLGLRRTWDSGSYVALFVTEDNSLGDGDSLGDWNYSNDAPDIQTALQIGLSF